VVLVPPEADQRSGVEGQGRDRDREVEIEPLQARLSKAQRDRAHEAAFKAQLQSLRLAMPDSPALSAFIRDANGIASDSGVAWQSVTHANPVAGADGVMSIAVGITIKGTYRR